MPDFFRLMSEYFWLIVLIIGAVNYRRAVRRIEQSAPNSGINQHEARMYLRRFAIGMELPWVVMGLGKILGFTSTVWEYFRPQDGNPFVIAWLGTVFAITCVYAWWVLLADGARKVREFNLMMALGRRASTPQPEWMIKLFAVFSLFFFPVWVYLVVSSNVPLPK